MPTNQHIKTCIMIVVLKLILYSKIIWVANRINYGGRSFKTFLLMSSYLRKFLLLLMLLSNNFDFVFNNDKQGHFVKMHPTMSSEYFFFQQYKQICQSNNKRYRISSNKLPRRLLDFQTVRCGVYYREALILKLGK